jgi:phospholipase C
MLENHSFDQMLGSLREVYPQLEGVDPGRPALNYDPDHRPYPQTPTTERHLRLDPMHDLADVARQLQGDNGGFVLDYARAYPQSSPRERSYIMGYYPLDFLPALHRLARDFTVCDHWFASVPGPTWANRFFALSGTSQGRVTMPQGPWRPHLHLYDQVTLFDRLDEAQVSWKVYYHDFPQSLTLGRQLLPHNAARYFPIADFFKDAAGPAEKFPQFCLIEPRYAGAAQNDDHPPHDVMKAQKLIADVYNALRANAGLWAESLLVVFYDEHGGFFDHVPPPAAVPPDDHRREYTFDRLGVRVPALLVSPWAARGVVPTTFDHTSLLKYLTEKWSLGPLGRRVQSARSIGEALRTAGPPRADTVARIELTADQLRPPDPDVEQEAVAHVSSLHRALAAFGQHLRTEADLEAPRVLSWWARLVEAVRRGFVRLWGKASALGPEEVELAHVSVPAFLKVQKEKAARQLTAELQDPAAEEGNRRRAARILETIMGSSSPPGGRGVV